MIYHFLCDLLLAGNDNGGKSRFYTRNSGHSLTEQLNLLSAEIGFSNPLIVIDLSSINGVLLPNLLFKIV